MKRFNDTTSSWEHIAPDVNPPHAVLGISIGTKMTGIAIEIDGALIDWRTRRFRGEWSEQKLEAILTYIKKFTRKYNVDAIAIKAPYDRYCNDRLTALRDALIATAQTECKVYHFNAHDLHSHYGREGRSFGDSLMKAVIQKKPVLVNEYHKEIKHRTKYYIKMFEAVACIHLCYEMWAHTKFQKQQKLQ